MKLKIFKEELLKWNKVHKLTNYNKKEIQIQIEDSLYILDKIKHSKTAIDIGTGAGFPGLILAIAMPKTKWYLVEPLKKRVAFLNLMKIKLELNNITIVANRIENTDIEKVDLITSRAVTKTENIINISKRFLKKSSKIVLYKGSKIEEEIKNCQCKYEIIKNPIIKNRNYLIIKELNV